MLASLVSILLLLTGCSSHEEEPLSLYSSTLGDDLAALYADAINSSEESIEAAFYGLTSPPLLATLQRKAAAGQQVRVVSDARASASAARYLSPPVDLVLREAIGLMHKKELIIDRRELWIGSANWTPHSLRYHGNLVVAIRDHSTVLHLLTQGKATLGECRLQLWHLPSDEGALQDLLDTIDAAESSIKVALFTFTNSQLTSALAKAKERGVDVRVVIESSSARGAGKKVIEQLDKANIVPAIGTGAALLHHKFCWVDEQTLVTGSANWTQAAFTKNEEVVLKISNLPARERKRLGKLWDAIWSESRSYQG